jgi:hypothetical protein
MFDLLFQLVKPVWVLRSLKNLLVVIAQLNSIFMSFCRILSIFSQCPAFLPQTAKERDKNYSVKSP